MSEAKTTTRLEEILDMLYSLGADMTTSKDRTGRTNLDIAIEQGGSCEYTTECASKAETASYE